MHNAYHTQAIHNWQGRHRGRDQVEGRPECHTGSDDTRGTEELGVALQVYSDHEQDWIKRLYWYVKGSIVMNSSHAAWQNSVKSMTAVVVMGGKSYNICSNNQMSSILEMGKAAVLSAAQGEQLSDEEVAKRLEAWRVDCGFANADWILSKLSPDEQERWKASYRFSGVSRATPS